MSGALRPGVNVNLSVPPVRQRTAGLERLVARVGGDERFIEDQCGALEAPFDVTVRPFVGRLAHRQMAFLFLCEVRLGPLEHSDRGRRRGRWRSSRHGRGRRRLHPDVSVGSRIGASGAQGLERVDGKGQRLKLDSNLFNGVSGSEFVDCSNGENRFTLVERFQVEPPLALGVGFNHRAIVGEGIGWGRQFVGRENRFHPGHCQRLAYIKVLYPRVRQRAQQQLAEQHAFGMIVLGVLCLSGHFRIQVGSLVVLADQFVACSVHTLGGSGRFIRLLRHGSPSSCSPHRASSRSGSCRSPDTGTDCPTGPAPDLSVWGWDSSSGMPPPP